MSRSIRTCSKIQRACCRLRAFATSTPLGLAFAVILLLMTGCSSMPLSVQAPALELPPIDQKYRQPCEEPKPLLRGTMDDLYLQGLEDVGPWGRCVRDHDKLIALIEYQESVRKKWAEQMAAQSTRAWWQFWK